MRTINERVKIAAAHIMAYFRIIYDASLIFLNEFINDLKFFIKITTGIPPIGGIFCCIHHNAYVCNMASGNGFRAFLSKNVETCDRFLWIYEPSHAIIFLHHFLGDNGMEKREICRKITDLGKYGKRTLSYSITMDGPSEDAPYAEFGICVKVLESGEESEARRLTPNKDEAEKLLDLAATNFVTPVSLPYIAQDWLER